MTANLSATQQGGRLSEVNKVEGKGFTPINSQLKRHSNIVRVS